MMQPGLNPILTRRQLLARAGGGAGLLALASLLADEGLLAAAETDAGGLAADPRLNPLAPKNSHFPAKAKNVIWLFMNGGPAQSHTFDLKDGSEYKAIDTTVPGIQISEHLPKVAEQMEHLAILRSMSTGDGNHPTARYLMHTGYRRGAGGTTYPSLGSLVSAARGEADGELPNFVSVGANGLSPGYLGPKHAALNVGDPARLVFYEWTTVTHAVPFEFKDLPLP